MSLWLFRFDQPLGFDAMRAETEDFTRIASHVRVNVEPGNRVVIFSIAEKHAAAVVSVIERAAKRSEGEDLERCPYAFGTRPELLSSRGPKRSVPGRSVRRLGDEESPSWKPPCASTETSNLRPANVTTPFRAQSARDTADGGTNGCWRKQKPVHGRPGPFGGNSSPASSRLVERCGL